MTLEKNRPDQTHRADPNPSQGVPPLEQLGRGPRTAISSAVARRLFRSAVSRLAITVVEEPSGRRLGQGGPVMRLHRPDEFYARLGRDGLIGFGEAYLTGAWDADDLAGFLTVPAARMATLIPDSLQRLRAFVTPRLPGHQRSTEANSQANISHHYDLSNDLFALFLDETLSYSSALFDTSLSSAGKGPGSVGDHLVATPPEPSSGGGTATTPFSTAPTSSRHRAARSSGSSTRPASPTARVSSRSAPDGVSSPSAPLAAARPCTRSPSRSSSSSWPRTGSPRPGSPTGSPSS